MKFCSQTPRAVVLNLDCTMSSPGSFKKCWCLGPTPNNSDLIDLRHDLDIRMENKTKQKTNQKVCSGSILGQLNQNSCEWVLGIGTLPALCEKFSHLPTVLLVSSSVGSVLCCHQCGLEFCFSMFRVFAVLSDLSSPFYLDQRSSRYSSPLFPCGGESFYIL